jgi:hypothetical protein
MGKVLHMTTPWQPPGSAAPNPPSTPAPPPTPRYGEYAPPGYVSPVPTPIDDQTSSRQTTTPPPTTDPSSVIPPTGHPVIYATSAPVIRQPRTADIVVTCILLFVGLIGMLIAVAAPAILPQALLDEYQKYGLSYVQPASLAGVSAILIVSHVVLWLAAAGGSIPLMVKRRIAFWVPLTAGVIAAILFWSLAISLMLSNPALANAIQGGN